MLLLELFAGIAVTMAVVGLYGVIAYSVGERTREIGIRMALGARREQVLRLVIRGGLGLGAAGVIAGLVGSLAASRLLRGLLFGVGPVDAATLAGTCTLVIAATLVATWVPAWRAARVDPITALQAE
jgi:ABC-type antimicrobial peptide transport system permease subunit